MSMWTWSSITNTKVDQNVLHMTCCDDKTNQVTPVTFGNFSVASQEIRLEDMIRMLPILSEKQYDNFITSKSLFQSIRLLSRILTGLAFRVIAEIERPKLPPEFYIRSEKELP